MNWNFSIIWNSLLPLCLALLTTIWISLGSILLGTAIGVLVGVLSLTTSQIVAGLAKCFIELFLALPVLVLLVWLYYSLPLLIPGFILDGQSCVVLGLGLSLSAFVAQIVRGGINSIPPGEIEVAYCTGMTRLETIRYILMPQVFHKSWLPLMGQYITTYKLSTLASVIAVPEILHTANSIIAQTYRPIEIYSVVAVMFVITVVPLNLLLRRVQKIKELGGTETL
ncbi:amino acid ABC transporter permease [Oscillatoriales cyanobacterium LEGE 11467]|uniref:Amino acid ABC transporter permease n=1 Tax=Zarconia navalis LEGE 11467 TaxID=1828826 RepID=A0A928VXW9_9CYAN|nr:amino acid ABC transporter permease [Zarconia navalis]MBE9042222.1 amino acid ABC transporter permease [Zarconia navalis LEGE 11467]